MDDAADTPPPPPEPAFTESRPVGAFSADKVLRFDGGGRFAVVQGTLEVRPPRNELNAPCWHARVLCCVAVCAVLMMCSAVLCVSRTALSLAATT